MTEQIQQPHLLQHPWERGQWDPGPLEVCALERFGVSHAVHTPTLHGDQVEKSDELWFGWFGVSVV